MHTRAAATPPPALPHYPPCVVLVDIDGTIIGEIDAQLVEYQLIIHSKRNKQAQDNALGRMFKDHLVKQLVDGLMRRGFPQFCAECTRRGIPVALYTASEDQWARFLKPCLERAVRWELAREADASRDASSATPQAPAKAHAKAPDFKFARLFTRKHCSVTGGGGYRKSLQRIAEPLYKSLRRRFSMPAGPADLLRRTVLIDNTPGVLAEGDRLVVVPTYDYACIYDVMERVDRRNTYKMALARDLLLSRASFLGRHAPRVDRRRLHESFDAWLAAALASWKREKSRAYELNRRNDKVWSRLSARLPELVEASSASGATSADLVRALSKGSTTSTSASSSTSALRVK